MDALEYRIKQALVAILEEAYPDRKFPDFNLEVMDKNTKTFHGDYRPGYIRISNLDREPRRVIATAIHELAHHVEQTRFGEVSHSDAFYNIYHTLLNAACTIGVIKKELVEGGFDDEASVKKCEKLCGPISADVNEERAYHKDCVLISVYNSYKERERLSNNRYIFNSRSRGWEKTVNKKWLDKELKFVSALDGCEVVVSKDTLDITVYAIITVTGDTFGFKDELSANGFRFRPKDQVWYKRVLSTDMPKIQPYVDKLIRTDGLKVSVTY